ncbi:nucleotidyl transferase AbiEii/AbiGii toxin family protein [Patescibacteria group bacterium]|nr:nucleotidyl transferase AbiEii/AbiGii toxin family protein [Patescibacteria group bacterium]
MINYSQIVKKASEKGVPVETIEKDYFIELFLFYFSKHKNIKDLIFRGGTALKKMYFPDYRFSEDLDFLTAIKKQEYKLNWKIRLSKQIPELLDFEKAIKKIEDYIKNNGF